MRKTFGSLFAGIGGFDLGFERAGLECKWQVEIDPFCQRVLAKHWPNVKRHDDVRTFPPEGDWAVDVLCGGPPCQPTSYAGFRSGKKDARWLWSDTLRIIDVLRPRIVLLENPPALLTLDRGIAFGEIVADLASFGMGVEWKVLSAEEFGLPQFRERLFITAYSYQTGISAESNIIEKTWISPSRRPDAYGLDLADSGPWSALPDVLRVDYGIPGTMDRLGSIGNSVVPQITEAIGRRIVQSMSLNTSEVA